MYSAIALAELVEYEIKDGLSKSVFSNGKVVYVNHTGKTVKCPTGKLEAYEFCME